VAQQICEMTRDRRAVGFGWALMEGDLKDIVGPRTGGVTVDPTQNPEIRYYRCGATQNWESLNILEQLSRQRSAPCVSQTLTLGQLNMQIKDAPRPPFSRQHVGFDIVPAS
jgi:hypothetical protein